MVSLHLRDRLPCQRNAGTTVGCSRRPRAGGDRRYRCPPYRTVLQPRYKKPRMDVSLNKGIQLTGSPLEGCGGKRLCVDKIRINANNASHVTAFLTHLAVNENVNASTQIQVPSTLLFLHRHVLNRPISQVCTIFAAM